jgi:hypothetical protein
VTPRTANPTGPGSVWPRQNGNATPSLFRRKGVERRGETSPLPFAARAAESPAQEEPVGVGEIPIKSFRDSPRAASLARPAASSAAARMPRVLEQPLTRRSPAWLLRTPARPTPPPLQRRLCGPRWAWNTDRNTDRKPRGSPNEYGRFLPSSMYSLESYPRPPSRPRTRRRSGVHGPRIVGKRGRWMVGRMPDI